MNLDQQRDQTDPVPADPGVESGGPSIGDHVMDILQDVERQFDRLRDAQSTKAQEVASLAERSSRLGEQEQELSRLRTELEDRRREIDAEQRSLEQRQQQLQRGAEGLERDEAELAEHRAAVAHDRRELDGRRSELNAELDSLRSEKEAFEEARDRWKGRRKEIDADFATRMAELEQLEEELGRDHERQITSATERISWLEGELASTETEQEQLRQQAETERHRAERLEERLADLTSQHEQVTQTRDQHAGRERELQERVESLEQEIADVRTKATRTENEALELAQETEADRDRIVEQLEQTKQKLDGSQSARDALTAELTERREVVSALEIEVAESHERSAELTRQLDDSRTKLELAGGKLAQFSQILAQQSEQLEQGAATVVVAEQQEQQIGSLTRQLAEAKLSGDPDAVQRKDQRIKELTEALRQARGQTGTMIDVDELEQRTGVLAEQNDSFRVELERAEVEAKEAKAQLNEHLAHTGEKLKDRERSIRQETESLSLRLVELEQELALARQGFQEQTKSHEEAAREFDEQRMELESRIADLEEGTPRPASTETHEASHDELTAKEKRILERGEHLRRRKARLKRVRRLLRQARTASAVTEVVEEERAGELRKLRQERVQLDEVKRMLTATEKRMIRRWAMPRAFSVVCWLLLLLALNAGGAWLASDVLHPVESTASVVIAAVTDSDEPISSAELEQWRSWCTDRLQDERFHTTLAKRMADRRLDVRAGSETLGGWLSQLGVDAAEPGQLVLSLGGTNEEELMLVLDVIASTLAARSKQDAERRASLVYGEVRGQRQERGRTRYAAVNPLPVRDERIYRALPIFGAGVAVCLTLILLFYRRLIRAKRLFEDDETPALAAA